MTKIKICPELPDHFIEMDWRDAQHDEPAFSQTLVEHYENGKIVILRNSPIQADYELLNRVSLPRDLAYKKVRDDLFQHPKMRLDSWKLHAQLLRTSLRDYVAIRREIRRASDAIRVFAKRVFPGYRFEKMPCSWRFTPTGPEHMHIDHFGALGDEPEKWYLRIFLNIDYEPRIWNLSYDLQGLAEQFYDAAGMEKWRDGRGCDFSREVGSFAFGGKGSGPEDGQPRHEIEWECGDVWIADSRLHSHQVLWGRRLMATGFEVDVTSMNDASLSLDARVRRLHERYGAA